MENSDKFLVEVKSKDVKKGREYWDTNNTSVATLFKCIDVTTKIITMKLLSDRIPTYTPIRQNRKIFRFTKCKNNWYEYKNNK